jgi:hypothetical protein
MAKWIKKSGEVIIKVAVVGQHGAGKKHILKHVARDRDQSTVRTGVVSGAEVVRTEFIWPEPIDDGPFVRVKVLAISGKPLHQAAEQLLLADCDALVFVVDCDPDRVSESRDCLNALGSNAHDVALNWANTTVVVQYNRYERYPDIDAEKLDAWLGVDNARAQRFVTRSDGGDDLGVAVYAAVQEVVARLGGQISKPQPQSDGEQAQATAI